MSVDDLYMGVHELNMGVDELYMGGNEFYMGIDTFYTGVDELLEETGDVKNAKISSDTIQVHKTNRHIEISNQIFFFQVQFGSIYTLATLNGRVTQRS